jgi:hypothetical protein
MKTATKLLLAYLTVGVGAVILGLGIKSLPAPSNPYPNTQHISPTPYPTGR